MLVPALISITLALLALGFMPVLMGKTSSKRTKEVLERIGSETRSAGRADDANRRILKTIRLSESESMDALLRKIPLMESTNDLLLKSGLRISFVHLLAVMAGIFLGSILLFDGVLGWTAGGVPLGLPLGILLSLFGTRMFLKNRVKARQEKFIDLFPDAVDMIVRSVRSGHPLSTALRMIAENVQEPVGTEFQQVVDEIAYGRSLGDSMNRLARRIDQTDIKFFVVVLNVQQETGGNLGEVLSNLSNILRKRKQMRLKIKALTAEGRMTAYILGALPLGVLAVLHLLSPGYLVPLFKDSVGNFILVLSAVLVLAAFFVVRKMVDIDV